MKTERPDRCYCVSDVPSFFVESLDPGCAVLDLHLGEEKVRLTREAFYSMVGSLAKVAVDLLEFEPPKTGAQVH